MTSFSFTTGNPNNLTAGANASMADIQGPFTDLRTFINGGTMDETNVPNLTAAFTKYERFGQMAGWAEVAGAVTGGFLLARANVAASNVVIGGTAISYNYVHVIDPTQYAANSRTTKLNIRAYAIPNGTAPAVTFTVALFPITGFGGAAAGGTPFVNTLGAVISGSQAVLSTFSANTMATVSSGDFNFPAAGAYVLAVNPSAAPAANVVIHVGAHVEIRRV